MNKCPIIVFDFETGGKNPNECSPIQIAAMVVDARKLEPIPGAVFNKMMCPMTEEEFNAIEDEALGINKKTKEQIKAAPVEKIVWQEFTEFVFKYRTKAGLPIPAGQNIQTFDLIIASRLCKKYGPWNKKRGEQALFNPYHVLDLKNILWLWFENLTDKIPDSYSMKDLRPYFALSAEGAHDALKDVKDTLWILEKFVKLHRSIAPRVTFKKG
jgi:DNA polymerase III epsilon subunit-like protein